MAESSKLRLKITSPDGETRTVDLTGSTLLIGSGEDAGLRVEDENVSELHVRLKLKDGQLTVTDLQSEHGTTLDGDVVGKDVALAPGQLLQLGGTQIVVEEAGADEGQSEQAAAPAKSGDRGASGKGGKAGRAGKAKGTHVSGGAAAAVASATDGNAARAIVPEPPEETEDESEQVAASKAGKQGKKAGGAKGRGQAGELRSVLDVPETFGNRSEIRDYAVRFLAEELPESLRPTKESRRLQVALVWGQDQFLEVRDLNGSQNLLAGETPGALPFALGTSKSVPLVVPANGEYRILLPADAKAELRRDGKTLTGDALLAAAQKVEVPVQGAYLPIELNDRVRIQVGQLQVIARYTKPLTSTSRSLTERIDVNFLSTLIILLMCAFATERMIAITDFGDLGLDDDLFKNKDRFAKYIARVEQKETPKLKDLSGVQEGAKAKDDEGKFGKQEAVKKEADPSKKGAPVVDVNKREEDRKKVMNSGLLAMLGGAGMGDAASNVFGPGGIGTGLNNALGGIKGGAGMGDAAGVGGLGARGGGAGGGGTALGIGGFGGKGSGRGRGGSGEFDLGGTGKATTKFVPGRTTVVGGLTADEVGRIVRRHWNEIKYCYEKELNKDPNLAGKVAVFFTIGPVGDVMVAQIRENDMNNSAVDECIVGNVRRWKFPSPRGGGTVDVTYPFIFTSQGN